MKLFFPSLALMFAVGLNGAVHAAPGPGVTDLIRSAGEATEEVERLGYLRQLAARSDLSRALRDELDDLIPVAEAWAEGRDHVKDDGRQAAENGYLCYFITNRIRPQGSGEPVYPVEPARDSPLHPLWALYRGRILIWRPIQSSPLLRVKATRDGYYGEGRRRLEEAQAAFPGNPVIGMYLGHPIPWEHRSQAHDSSAPRWANFQREGLERLVDVVHWWIDERQLPDGQFGGGWGDDVEMWRNWVPALVAFDDPKIEAAQARISEGMFARPHLREGFTSRLTDVEHSNEDTTDTILPMMHLQPDDALWQQRALRLVELMRSRWTGANRRGMLQFKSIYFNVDQVDEASRRAFDTVYHPAIVQPALLYWQRTADIELSTWFGRWLDTWIEATAREENGKPAGILPSTIAWPSGEIGVVASGGAGWWEPFPLNHNDALYNWPGASRLMSSTLLLAWHMTREERYLGPIRSMADYVRLHSAGPNSEPGSPAWIARQAASIIGDTLSKYRTLSGDTQYDDLLGGAGTSYGKFRLGGAREALEESLQKNAEAFRFNWPAYTSEMRWTDRVFLFTDFYLKYLPEPAPPSPDLQTLYSSVTGDPGTPLIFPLNAVRWRTAPRDIAALVTDSGSESFAAELYHFGAQPRLFSAELLLLHPGDYEVTFQSGETSAGIERHHLTVTTPRAEVPVRLPPRQLTYMKVKRLSESAAGGLVQSR